ncbi:acyl-CoA thioesterase [Reichenbachiella versicolor]|uniref:acyl-CoA thioesterase n=1 Tax=Reichenbachiella versicolor TaxID=1821036 RepID=UPI000D6E94A5|nr:acyl-CoA thioesterase [Reichenbachiella versicolor]
MKRINKTPKESEVVKTELVLPNDTNSLDNLFGGRLLEWMDVSAAIAAQRHSNCVVVTASVDNVSFVEPIKQGDVVTLKARVTRAFNSSMEVYIEVTAENPRTKQHIGSNSAFYTLVAMDNEGHKVIVPEIKPETKEERKFFKTALQRRELRLVMAGKMRLKESLSLKDVLTDE